MRIKNLFQSTCFGIFSILFLYFCVFLVLSGDLYIITGNLHDLWIPHISAYALGSGLSLHQEFHTPFGFIYSYLNYFSSLIIQLFPSLFSSADLLVISSLLFSGVTVALFLLVKLSGVSSFVSWFVLVLVLSINFQLRDVSKPFDHNDVLWYGSYNGHLWSLLLLQVLSIIDKFFILKEESLNKLQKNDAKFYLFILMQFLCVIIFLNYKVNFFLASLAVSSSIFFLLNKKLKVIYFLSMACSLIIATLMVQLLTNYSYTAYLNDILHAVQSKKSFALRYFLSLFLFFPVFLYAIFYKNLKQNNMSSLFFVEEFSSLYLKLKDFIKKYPIYFFARFYFCISIGMGLFVAIIGDWQKPVIYFWVVLFFYIIMDKSHYLAKRFSYVLLFAFLATNYISLIYMSFHNHTALSSHIEDKNSKPNRYLPVRVIDEKVDFFASNYIGAFNLIQFFEKDPADTGLSLKFSSLHKPSKRHWGLKFSNADYIEMLNDAVRSIKKFGYKPNDDLMMLEFVNPLPILLGSRFPLKSYHWIHVGTTFSSDNINKLHTLFEQIEMMYVPALSVDGKEQTFLNCSFYDWNLKQGKFSLFHSSPQGLLFISKEKAENLEFEPLSYSASMLQKNCEVILSDVGRN